jgi:hypothetical protein
MVWVDSSVKIAASPSPLYPFAPRMITNWLSTPVAHVEQGYIPERYSSVFFFKAHRSVSVGPIDHFVTEKSPAKYPNITALEFHREMTNILY